MTGLVRSTKLPQHKSLSRSHGQSTVDAFTVPTLVVVSAALVHCNIPLTNEIPTKHRLLISISH